MEGQLRGVARPEDPRLARRRSTSPAPQGVGAQLDPKVRQNPKGRRAKNKARLNNYEAMLAEGTKEKEARLEIPIPNGPRLGNKVIEVEGLQKAFGDKLLIENLSFRSRPRASWASSVRMGQLDDPVPHDDGGGATRWRHGDVRRDCGGPLKTQGN